jgi:hypothetical protein
VRRRGSEDAPARADRDLRTVECFGRQLDGKNTETPRSRPAARRRRPDILDTAWRLGILARLKPEGGERVGPCPVCGGRDRFSINPAKQLWNCRGCGVGGDAYDLVRHLSGGSFRDAVRLVDGEPSTRRSSPSPPARQEEDASKARWLWSRRKPITGSVAETYLRRARGYHGPIPSTLGFLPATDQHPPSMIAAFGLTHEPECGSVEIADDAVRGVHLTRLKPDGGDRIDKIMVGRGSVGFPISLFLPNDLNGLAIVEGIEDGVSIYAATGLGVWVAGCDSRMPPLAGAVLSYVEFVNVFGHDDGKNGRRYATELTERLRARGFETKLKFLRMLDDADGQG